MPGYGVRAGKRGPTHGVRDESWKKRQVTEVWAGEALRGRQVAGAGISGLSTRDLKVAFPFI